MEEYLQVRDVFSRKIKNALISNGVRSAPAVLVGSSHVRPFITENISPSIATIAVPGGTLGHMISVCHWFPLKWTGLP